MKKKSWLTTLFGWLSGVAGIVAVTSPDPTTRAIAGGVAAVGTAMLGTAARDNNVTSEDVGIKK